MISGVEINDCARRSELFIEGSYFIGFDLMKLNICLGFSSRQNRKLESCFMFYEKNYLKKKKMYGFANETIESVSWI